MFCGDHGALDDEHVEAGLDRHVVVLPHALWSQRAGRDHAFRLDLLDPLSDQLRLDRLSVYLLHAARGLGLREIRDLLELGIGILVPRPDAFEIQHREPAEPADDPRGLGRHHAVHRGGQHGKLESVGAERPGYVDVIGIAGPA